MNAKEFMKIEKRNQNEEQKRKMEKRHCEEIRIVLKEYGV